MDTNAADDDDFYDDILAEGGPTYNNSVGRRKSVFAEAYNPEEDEEDEKIVSNLAGRSFCCAL